MKESTLEQNIKKRIENRGGLCLKWVSPGFTGVPDRIAIFPGGRIIFIEVKRRGRDNGLSSRQKRVIDQLTALGCTVLTVNKLEDLDAYL